MIPYFYSPDRSLIRSLNGTRRNVGCGSEW